MSGYQEVEFTISADGKTVEIEAHGFKGTDCKAATKPFLDALGIAVEENAKPEMRQPATESVKAKRELRR